MFQQAICALPVIKHRTAELESVLVRLASTVATCLKIRVSAHTAARNAGVPIPAAKGRKRRPNTDYVQKGSTMEQPTAAIQLIVFGERNTNDLPGILHDAKTAGYAAIETGNLFAAHGEDTVRQLVEANGLSICGAHFGYGDYADPVKLSANIAYCKAMGIPYLMCSGVADPNTAEGYRQSCVLFNEVGKRAADAGISFQYHNHWWEFNDLGGGTIGMDILAAETDAAVVSFNIDVFWVTIGGQNPATFIRKNASRAGYFHFKDGRKKDDGSVEFLELGRGITDLKGAMAAAKETTARWIVYEQDSTALPHTEAITASREYMRKELGV